MKRLGIAAAGLTLVALAAGLADPSRFWAAYAASTLFWLSLCAGAAAFVAALEITGARWSDRVVRRAERWARLLVLPAAGLAVLPLGARHLYPWVTEPTAGLEAWLAPGAVVARDLLAVGVLLAATHWLLAGEPGARTPRAVVLALVWAGSGSLLSWDLVMSLQPGWISTLFGAYFFVGGLYAGIAVVSAEGLGPQHALPADASHDLGKLLFGCAMVWGYFVWSQYLVAWYGNLPREAVFWLQRAESGWGVLGLGVVAVAFVAPFTLLLGVRLKRSPRALGVLSAAVLVALWAEKLLLVGPAVRTATALPVGLTELTVGAGVSAFVAGVRHARRRP